MTGETPRIYLDNAATSFPKPASVHQAVSNYMVHNGAAFGRGSYADSDAAAQIVTECRQRIGRLISARAQDLAFTFNCTDSLNLLLRGLLKRGDRVVTTTLEHNSVLRPLNQLRRELDLSVSFANFDPGTGELDLSEMEALIQSQPVRLVVLNHASNVTGVVQPVSEVVRMARGVGALVLLDAAQTTGHHEISVEELGVDFLATAGHKGLLGPLGTGLLYVRPGLGDQLVPIRCGGTGTQSESPEQPRDLPGLFESGNMNMPGISGLNASVEWLLDQDRGKLSLVIKQHLEALRSGLEAFSAVRLLTPADSPNAGILSFTIEGVDSREAATILDSSFGVQCRAGFHCAPLVHEQFCTQDSGGSLRLSPGVFTSDEDIERTVNAVQQLCDAFSLS